MSGRFAAPPPGRSSMANNKNWYDYDVTRPFLWTWQQIINHSGTDYGAPCGTPVTSLSPGRVVHSATHPWGGQIDVLLDDTTPYDTAHKKFYVLSYLHTQQQYVQEGQTVSRGDVLGQSGQPPPGAGFGSGCHVHFEVTEGQLSPYTSQYWPSRNPNPNQSYPLASSKFVNWVKQTGGGGGGGGGGSGCGNMPDPTGSGTPRQ